MHRIADRQLANRARSAALRCCLAALVAASVFASTRARGLGAGRADASAGDPAPPASAAFLAAYARGDAAAAARAASPLYAAEWARRGLDARELAAILPRRLLPGGSPAPWVAFAYAGGVVDARGFRHLLYAASEPVCDAGCRATSVWRVDAEPSGRVIWAEMVWLFDDGGDAVVTRRAPQPLPPGLPGELAGRAPRLVLAIGSATGPEGYYAASVDGRPDAVVFFAIGPDGDARPDAWSYGRRDTGPSAYGRRHEERATRLGPPDVERLRRSYLASLP